MMDLCAIGQRVAGKIMAELRHSIGVRRDGWTATATGGDGITRGIGTFSIARGATSSIHAALSRAGIQQPIDPLRAELDSEWVGRTDWSFTCSLAIPPRSQGRHCALRIGMIDGTCEVVLGGVSLGMHMSAFVPFEARIPDELRASTALLELRFKAPVNEVLRWEKQLGARPVNGDWTPFCFARVPACSFGWDWGPRVPGVGFSAANFICWDDARIEPISVAQRWNRDGSCTISLDVRGDLDPARCRVTCLIDGPDGEHFELEDGCRSITVRPKRLWQPWERGSRRGCSWMAQAIAWEGKSMDDGFLDGRQARFALRNIELDTSLDDIGRGFRFIVNGKPMFAKGANFIPTLLDGTHVRDWREEMQLYRATGFNMVRVWGGGKYMPHAFYNACDELGILVWQDFMFACATYPEDEPFASLIAREADHQVRRLSRHPSMALWCGGNEDILAWWSWGWKDRLQEGQSWGRKYWLETLPAAVAAHDPGTPYWAESPYSGSMELHPNDCDHGDRHTWDAEAKIEGYRTILPRFSSEFGHQSPPCIATLRESFPPEALMISSEALKLRQKAWGGDDFQYKPFLDARFRVARGFDEYVAQAQHLQARAMDVAMRWLRANAPRSMGALIWQWNDVWAGHSWSLVDVAGRVKPAWHAVRRACAPRLLSIEPTGDFVQLVGGQLEVVLVDDRAFENADVFTSARVRAIVQRIDFHGVVRAEVELSLTPYASAGFPAASMRARIPSTLLADADARRELLVARIEGEPTLARATWFLAEDAQLMLPTPVLRGCGLDLVRAERVVRELWIEDDEHASRAAVSSSWITLLPGDIVEIPAGARSWSANQFAKPHAEK